MVPPKSSRKKPTPQTSTPRAPDDHSPLVPIPINVQDSEHTEEDSSEDPHTGTSLQTPGPGSSVSYASEDLSTSFKRPRAKTSGIHEYVTQRNNTLVCNRCSKVYQLSGGTGAIIRHLREKHSIDATSTGVVAKRIREGQAIDLAILRGVEINTKAEEKRKEELMGRNLDKVTLEYLYLQWTVPLNLPFKHVRNSAFRTFLEYVNPVANRMLPNSDSTVKIHAEALFAEGKQRLRYMLATALSDIHITCDIWTSSNHLGLLAVVAHFTSEKGKLITVTLGLVELQGEHSGLNQATIVLNVLEDYEIRNKLGYMVMDNANPNDTLISVIADTLREEGVFYDATQRRLRCNGHVINLAVQAFLFGQTVDDYEYPENLIDSPSDAQLNQWRKLGPLGKLHNIVVWITGSPQRIQAFKKHSEDLMPRRDNSTRWNSWYAMLDWALRKLKKAIIHVTSEEPELAKDVLTAEEWKTLGHISDFLRNFYDATKATEGHKATLNRVLPTMDFLANIFEEAIEEFADHDFMRESLQTGFTKLLKYWNKTERSPAYIAAIVLDPTVKWTYFEDWDPTWQPNMEATMKEFWETKYRSSTGLSTYNTTDPTTTKTDNKFLQWMNKKKGDPKIRDELDQYIVDPLVLAEDLEGRTVLDWWLEPKQRTRFPLLSLMAIDIYSIPAMSSEPERVFSGAKHTISEQRASLKSTTIELLECLKSWFRIGIFTEQDLHAIIDTMEEGATEAMEDLEAAVD